MKLEDFESSWALQQPVPPAPADLDALRGTLSAKLAQRRRLLIIGIVTSVIGLLVMQAVSIANLYHMRQSPPWTFAAHLLVNQGVSLALLFELIRSVMRHRRLVRGRAESVRDVIQLSLRNVADQIWDIRFATWLLPALTCTALISAYLNNPVSRVGWQPFLSRAGFVVALYAFIAAAVRKHYQHRLQPERERLQATLAEMDKES